jgi:hypothetical protein
LSVKQIAVKQTPKEIYMNVLKTASLLSLFFLLGIVAQAQYADDPYGSMMQTLEMQMQNTDAQLNQMMLDSQTRTQEAQQNLITWYRQQTGDYTTPDAQALDYAMALYCQQNPVECNQTMQQALATGQQTINNSQQNMANQQAAFEAGQQSHAELTATYDANNQAWQQTQNAGDYSQQQYIQTNIYEEATYTNPTTGSSYSLPYYPSQNTSYQTPQGQPLTFDYATNTWYQLDGNNTWSPLTSTP